MAARITVVGAGVLGLSAAVRLAEHGHEVDVLARDLPLETASALAGLWLPEPAPAGPHPIPPDMRARTRRWAAAALAELRVLAADPASGVRLLPGTLLHARPVPPPGWASPEFGLQLHACADPAPGYPFGYRATLPVVDAPRYLEQLRGRLIRAGGTLTRLPLAALPPRGVVVNCTGVSARALAGDPEVRPVRSQLVVLADPGLRQWCWDGESADHLLWVLPRGHDVVVGGTAQDGSWDSAPDPQTARRLLRRAVATVPALDGAAVLGHRVGLAPGRLLPRLEVEHRPHADDPRHAIVHCYGHGRSGLTWSWGCADDVLAEVNALVTA
ncbi:MAG TPA: FAD-dependent oxidoreductase [Kineosporiaceae bacterium]|nr:FAD-dependent oxidoreductase [Kineosporiaceae bacterium]